MPVHVNLKVFVTVKWLENNSKINCLSHLSVNSSKISQKTKRWRIKNFFKFLTIKNLRKNLMMMTSCSLTQKKNLPLRVKLKVTTTNLRANLMMRPTQRTALSILLHLKQAKQTRRIKLRVKFPRESGLMNLMEKEVKPKKIPKARKLKTLNLVSVAIKIE